MPRKGGVFTYGHGMSIPLAMSIFIFLIFAMSISDSGNINWYKCFWKVTTSCGNNQVQKKIYFKGINCNITHSGKSWRQPTFLNMVTQLNGLWGTQRIKY